MVMAYLVQTRQSNKYGSVRNDETINLHLGSSVRPWVSIPCFLQDISHIYWFHPLKTINQERTKNPEMRSNLQQIVSYCLGLHIQNPGLRVVDLEPSPKRCSDKINMWKQGRNTQSCILQPGLTENWFKHFIFENFQIISFLVNNNFVYVEEGSILGTIGWTLFNMIVYECYIC